MGRVPNRFPLLELLLASALIGCGGGSSVAPPPPPSPDFSLSLSANTLSLSQGGNSSALNISVNPSNGFTGSVQVTFSGLPSGVVSNPVSPFNIVPSASTPVVFGASASATTGNFTISAQGASGSLSHSQSLTLTVQAGVPSNLPRSSYVRTDSVLTAEAPLGEPHHRHIAYDPVNKQVFVPNRAMKPRRGFLHN